MAEESSSLVFLAFIPFDWSLHMRTGLKGKKAPGHPVLGQLHKLSHLVPKSQPRFYHKAHKKALHVHHPWEPSHAAEYLNHLYLKIPSMDL